MLELPEVLNMSSQLNEAVIGKQVKCVLPPSKAHKFCWFNGEPQEYSAKLENKKIVKAEGFGIFVEIEFEEGYKLAFNDGVNVRLIQREKVPKNYQLMIEFEDGMALVFTVAMYGGIFLHQGEYDNEYYVKSKQALSPFSGEYEAYYKEKLAEVKPTLSAKGFLATEQRFPGIGNGVIQDILFEAGIHPKRKMGNLSDLEKEQLFEAIITTLKAMAEQGGRNTEKDLYGNSGGYITKMSKLSQMGGCPNCGGLITKENFLGGSIYYCMTCQPRD